MSSSPRPAAPPLLVLVLGVLAVSTSSLFIRYAQSYAPSLVIAAWRLSLAALFLAPVALTRRRGELVELVSDRGAAHSGHSSNFWLALLSGVFLAAHFATWITSLAYTTVASAVVLVDTTPLWVALAAPFVLHESISRPVKIGLALAMFGSVLVGLSDACTLTGANLVCPPLSEFVRGRAFLGDILALSGAVAAAAYLILGRRVRTHVSLLTYIFVVYGAAAVVLVGLMLVSGAPAVGYPPAAYGWFLALALIPQLLGHSTYNWALGYLPAAYVSIALLGEPVASTLMAVVLLGEIPGLIKITGAFLTLAGIYLASRSQT